MVVRIENLRKTYRKVVAVEAVSLDVRRGELFGLIGPDGAGKSTVLHTAAGVLRFDSGEVRVFDVRLDSESAAERIKTRIGFMPQGLGLNLYGDLSVDENIDFFARLRLITPTELARRKARLLAMTRLERYRARPMKQLSGGMKQKLGLVCTLIHEPELVLLDEPTTGVDPVSRRDFWTILAELLHENGATALVSTAYMDEASRFHRIALMYGGRILAAGEPDAVSGSVPGAVVTVRSVDQGAAHAQLKQRFPHVELLGARLKVFVPNADPATAESAVRATLDPLPVDEITTDDPGLEEAFVALLPPRATKVSDVTQLRRSARSRLSSRDSAIEARELSRSFGKFMAVDRVSFRVPQGEIFGLLGANGAGKTTVIKMLTGIVRPTAGVGQVAGVDMRTASRAIKERIGYMSQAFSLYTDLTAIENIRLYAGIYGLTAAETRKRIEWLVDMAGLAGYESRGTASLPMGLRQRLALGCALVHRPQVLFLDEPTSGVDPVGRAEFWDILFALSRAEGVAILITTHYMSEAERCDHLALMHSGRVVADAPPERMKRETQTEAGSLIEVRNVDGPLALTALREAGYRDAALFGNYVHTLSKQTDLDLDRIPALLHRSGFPNAIASVRPLTMEDVFVYRITALEAIATAERSES